MWADGWHAFSQLLGLDLPGNKIGFTEMAWRGGVVFVFAILLARLADRRFMGRSACFDFMLGVILGSVLSRAVNGTAPFLPTLGTSALLVLFHRLVGMAAHRWHRFSVLVKGSDHLLVKDGKINESAMRWYDITPDDLLENLRLHGNVSRVEDVAEARLERNGSISVVHRPGAGKRPPTADRG